MLEDQVAEADAALYRADDALRTLAQVERAGGWRADRSSSL
jgi:hypothetical protein